jgi:hypothetical protein
MIPDRKTAVRAVLAASMAALLVGPVGAIQAHSPNPTLGTTLFEQDQELTYHWRAGSSPPSAFRTAINAAANDANTTRRSKAPTFVYASDGKSPIGYGAGATCGPNGIACFSRDAPNGFTMWFRQQGYVFDWGSLKWCQSYDKPPNGCYDVENIALDEFGHVQILGHHVNKADQSDYLDSVVQTYSRTKPNDGWDAHALGRCDVATLQMKYDVTNSSTKLSTCLDLATTLALTPSAATIPYGTNVTLTATFRIADQSGYGRLRNNGLSNRIISWQRRAAGTTTWTTVGEMTAAGTGTYTVTVALKAATEFRAIYKATTAEGLRKAESPTVKVSVSGTCTGSTCPLSAPER